MRHRKRLLLAMQRVNSLRQQTQLLAQESLSTQALKSFTKKLVC
jgi:hypothetical protein